VVWGDARSYEEPVLRARCVHVDEFFAGISKGRMVTQVSAFAKYVIVGEPMRG
jgi:hypothetical protein